MAPSPFSILLVDDDPLLSDLMTKAAKSSFPEALFIQVTTFEEAKAYLDSLDGKRPYLVLLDIDLQDKVDGLDFLALLRAHPVGRLLPVVMLSGISTQENIERAYFYGASSFMIKPFELADWKSFLAVLRTYWYHTVTLPFGKIL
ncbi:hypothetical protein GCM10028805_46680 [Spirosoma harenae]